MRDELGCKAPMDEGCYTRTIGDCFIHGTFDGWKDLEKIALPEEHIMEAVQDEHSKTELKTNVAHIIEL